MIGFVEELPTEWHPKWEGMRLNSKHRLELKKSELKAILSTAEAVLKGLSNFA
ncbi:hypothetical protein V1520DRAFT_95983 [Lipomyces starkeyi]